MLPVEQYLLYRAINNTRHTALWPAFVPCQQPKNKTMKRYLYTILFLVIAAICQAQDPAYPAVPAAPLNITAAESFVDNDPGVGNGTPMTVSAAVDISNVSAVINVNGLSNGVHHLFIRTRNTEGSWSITNVKEFLYDANPNYTTPPPAPQNIIAAEYFIDTDPGFVAAVEKTMVAIGKAPIKVKDVVGFAVNRLLHALVIESIRLVEEGVCSPAEIDTACKLGLGHPIGPFELLDNTQNSLSLSVHEILHQAYGERFLPRPLLRQLVAAGYNGRKAGRGWHRYDSNGKRL